jgi:hypothetical protein
MRYYVRARNTSTASENKIHDDEVARRYGFERGLVPGVDVYAYLTRPAAHRWGIEWLERGAATAQFVNPAYDGDELFVTVSERQDSLDAYALSPEGKFCASTHAWLPADGRCPELVGYPELPLADPPLAPTLAALGRLPVLGSLSDAFDAEKGLRYLDDVGDPLELYRQLRVAHPGWLLRWSNWILKSNVALGPWIHTASELRHYGLVQDGAMLQIRGRICEVFERKGQTFIVLDLVLLADGALVQSVRHSAIVQPLVEV